MNSLRQRRATAAVTLRRISRSVGVEGGVVVLWPRIVLPRGSGLPDAHTRDLGRALQKRVADLVRIAVPDKPLDVRPEPERVCPKAGCKAASVGVLFTRAGGGCAAIVTVSRPGTAPAKLLPWIGEVRLHAEQVGFREPPEKALGVRDYVRCSDLAGRGAEQRDAIVSAIRAAAE